MKFITKFAVPTVIATLLTTTAIQPVLALDDTDKPAIEKIIRDYLLNNPGILGEMQVAYEEKQKTEQAEKQKLALSSKADIIYSSKYHMEIGAKDAKYTVVEFFDYNCPFCQRAMNDMEKIIASNPDVKFVIKEWPVLGQNSFDAHNVSLAFNALMPEKYAEFHQKLFNQKGQKTKDNSMQVAMSFGLKEADLLAEMQKPSVLEALGENNEIASDLGITGTPSYIIGDEVVFGAVGFDQINQRLGVMRAKDEK